MTDRPRLIRHAVRRMPLVALGVTALIGGGFTVARAAAIDSLDELLWLLRLDAVMLAAAAALCLEDSAEVLTVSAPLGRRNRRLMSVAVTGLLSLVLWSTIAVLAATVGGRVADVPFGGLTVELLALTAAGWLIAALFNSAFGWRGSGPRSAAALALLTVCTLLVPRTLEWLWRSPGPAWRIVHVRWSIIGLVSVAGFLLLSRDPARRTVLPTHTKKVMVAT